MKAAVLFGKNDLRVTDVPIPSYGEDEALVRVRACAICGSDPKIVANGWPGSPPFGSFIPGHEFAGEVVEVGKGVTRFAVGDRVAVEPHKGCCKCINCIRGLYNECLNYGKPETGHRHMGFTSNGGYAEYAVCHSNNMHNFSNSLDYVDATLLTTAGTALYGMQRAGWVQPGDAVAVVGPGPIGLVCVQLAKACGAGKVILIGTRAGRLEIGRKVGADMVVNSHDCDAIEAVAEATDGIMADLVIESSGAAAAGTECVQLCKRGGRIAVVSMYSEPVPMDLNKVVQWNMQICGGRAEGEYVIERAIPLFEQGKINTRDMITHTFSLDNISEAFSTYVNRLDNALKVVVVP